MTSELDKQLAQYLDEEQQARARGHTIATLRAEIYQYSNVVRALVTQLGGINVRVSNLEVNEREVFNRLDGHGAVLSEHHAAIAALRKRAKTGADDEEMATGNFNLAAIEAEVKIQQKRRMDSERARADRTEWWRRQTVIWIVAAAGFLMATVITVLVTLLLSRQK